MLLSAARDDYYLPKIHMYILYMPHRQFAIINKEKFQDQWTMIQ